jgi:hypothetical protein
MRPFKVFIIRVAENTFGNEVDQVLFSDFINGSLSPGKGKAHIGCPEADAQCVAEAR